MLVNYTHCNTVSYSLGKDYGDKFTSSDFEREREREREGGGIERERQTDRDRDIER